MFKRKIIDKLEEWKNADRHKPLILRGARQVGKTTIVNEFGSQFENYLYFNMERNENVRWPPQQPKKAIIRKAWCCGGWKPPLLSMLILFNRYSEP